MCQELRLHFSSPAGVWGLRGAQPTPRAEWAECITPSRPGKTRLCLQLGEDELPRLLLAQGAAAKLQLGDA